MNLLITSEVNLRKLKAENEFGLLHYLPRYEFLHVNHNIAKKLVPSEHCGNRVLP